MKDPRSYVRCEEGNLKIFRLVRESNPLPCDYRSSVLSTELASQLPGAAHLLARSKA